MPRTLPWLAQKAEKPKPKPTSSVVRPKCTREPPPENDEDHENSDLDGIQPRPAPHRKRRRLDRTPSTSPPPAPPEVEYMREGYQGDDIWMMVEDEFYSTAQLFTKHIHHAEYVRLKKLARERGVRTSTEIAQPIDERVAQSDMEMNEIDMNARPRQLNKARQVVAEHDMDDEEDEYVMDAQLAGLMASSKKVSRDLSGLVEARANTRAAAGFPQSPQATRKHKLGSPECSVPVGKTQYNSQAEDGHLMDESDSDDLNNASKSRLMTASASSKLSARSMPRTGFFKPFARKSPQPEAAEHPFSEGSVESDDAISRRIGPHRRAAAELLAKRRVERQAKEKKDQGQRGKAKSMIEVPTFLI